MPCCGLGIADDLFGVGVPLDSAIESNCDIGEVADGHGAVVAVDIADGLSSVGDAFEEVLHVVAGSFAFVEGFQCFFFEGVRFESIDGIAGQFSAVDEDAAGGAFQQQSVIEAEVIGGVADVQDGAIFEGGGNVELCGGVVL